MPDWYSGFRRHGSNRRNFIEPLLYGSHTGISSLAILVAAVFWATIWGPVGFILSTPLTVCLIVLGRHVPQLNFLEVLLGDEPVLLPEQCFYQRCSPWTRRSRVPSPKTI